MPAVNLDDLFGSGAPLSRDVLVKAKLRVRVVPHSDPAVRGAVDHAIAAYAAALDGIADGVAAALGAPGADLAKGVVRQPFRPGSRGGTWYRDSKGNIRYGVPPEGKFTGYAPQEPPPRPELEHLRPRSFLGGFGSDRELTDFLTEHPSQHGMTDAQLRFLGAWYGVGDAGGGLFDAFLACAGITRDDIKHASTLRFGSKQLSYEEAVFEFFAAQGPLFMGKDAASPEDEDEWHRVLNDEIKPLIDDVFVKYEDAKADDEVQRRFVNEPARLRGRFIERARAARAETDGVADAIAGDWNPARVTDAVIAGMRAVGLFARRARAERRAAIHGRPHLRDAVVMDGHLLDGGPRAPLAAGLGSVTPSQLMLVYLAAELNHRWDPDSRSFSGDDPAESGASDLAEAVLNELASRTERWAGAVPAIRGRLEQAVPLLVARLNEVNAREGYPEEEER